MHSGCKCKIASCAGEKGARLVSVAVTTSTYVLTIHADYACCMTECSIFSTVQ